MSIKNPPNNPAVSDEARQIGAAPGSQIVASRTGLNTTNNSFSAAQPGCGCRSQHTLPNGALSLQAVYAGFGVTSADPDTETPIATSGTGGYYAVSAVPVAGGATYAVGDTIVPTIGGSANQKAPTLLVTSVSAGAITGLDVIEPGLLNVVPATGLAQTSTSGSGTGATFTLTVKACAVAFNLALEQVWGTQTAFSQSNPTGVLPFAKGATQKGPQENLYLPSGDFLITDPLSVSLASGATIGLRLASPGTGFPLGRFLSGSSGLNEYSHSNITLSSSAPVNGGTYATAASPANAMQPTFLMGKLATPAPSHVGIGDSIMYGSTSVASATGGTTSHDTLDANGYGGWWERAMNINNAIAVNFAIPSDRAERWQDSGNNINSYLRMRALSIGKPSHITYATFINDFTLGTAYATVLGYIQQNLSMILATGVNEIWMPTCTPAPTSTQGLAAVPTIGAAGSGYTPGTFNVTASGGTGTAFIVNVTANGSGNISSINSIVAIGYYTVLPTNNVATVATQGGSGLTLTCSFAKCLDLASQSTNSANTAIQALNTDLLSRASWLTTYKVTRVIDLRALRESSPGSGLWIPGNSFDAVHDAQSNLAALAAAAAPQMAGATL